ncbi:MAG: hypothetical protein HF314_07430 [Ignavibacteria bacterium]|jgi:hypothetical protein|nr:hypothetical protein [Ignavibacteria bacterium]MCU7502887.1 hypothetical protein [Ignavibacteria bacterium]MCU7515619.1 hypothetical protein [Ignavibacteria bacterium]
MEKYFFNVRNSRIYCSDVLNFMKLTGLYHTAHTYTAMNSVLKEFAKKLGVAVSDEMLQNYADYKRKQLGLLKAEQMQKYLDTLEVSLEDWETSLEDELYRIELRNKLGGSIYVGDAWNILKTIPEIRNSINEIIAEKAGSCKLDLSDEELQKESDVLRRALNLHKKSDLSVYLNSLNMNEEDWEKNVTASVFSRKLKEKNISPLTKNEVASILNRYPVIKDLLSKLVFGNIIRAKASELNISVSDEELNSYAENFRRALGLHKTEHFNIWLNAAGLNIEDFEIMAETAILAKKVIQNSDELQYKGDIEKSVKCSSFFSDALLEVISQELIASEARQKGMKVSDAELQELSDALRRVNGYHKASVFEKHLEFYGLPAECWEEYVERQSLIKKMKEAQTTDERVLEYLHDNKEALDSMKAEAFRDYAYKLSSKSQLEWFN